MFCNVRRCRFKTTHSTRSHRCGLCGVYGHGQIECGEANLLEELEQYSNDKMPENMQCSVRGCTLSQYHTTSAHHCDYCGCVGNPSCCSYMIRKCPSCKSFSVVDVSVTLFTGSDCIVCLERKPCAVFRDCRHANVCAECVIRL